MMILFLSGTLILNTDEIDKNNVSNLLKSLKYNNGGEDGIRTHE